MPLLRPSDIAKSLGMTSRHVHRIAAAKRFPGQRMTKGGQLRFFDCPALRREIQRLSAAKSASSERTRRKIELAKLGAKITAGRVAYRRAFGELSRVERWEVKDLLRDFRNPRKEIDRQYTERLGLTPAQLAVVNWELDGTWRDTWRRLGKWARAQTRRIDRLSDGEEELLHRELKRREGAANGLIGRDAEGEVRMRELKSIQDLSAAIAQRFPWLTGRKD
jgi:hypothetical protein